MRQSFDALWEVMEARRRQMEDWEVPSAYRFEQTRQARRWARGCPDEEALCGWVDGQLRRHSLRRWLTVWRHVRIRRCRECQAEIVALAAAVRPDQPWRAWLGSTLKGSLPPLLLTKRPLAWASSALAVALVLSLSSIGTHDSFLRVRQRSTPPVTEDTGTLPPVDSGNPLDDQSGNTTIWGD
jgi:hypothetical protein